MTAVMSSYSLSQLQRNGALSTQSFLGSRIGNGLPFRHVALSAWLIAANG